MKKPYHIRALNDQGLAKLNKTLDDIYERSDRRVAFKRPDGRSSVWGTEVDQAPSTTAIGAQRDRQILFVEIGGVKTEVGSIDSAGNIRLRGVVFPNTDPRG